MSDKSDTLKAKMLDALEKQINIVTTACKEVGIHRDTHYEWLKKDKEYKRKVKEIDNVALDFAESALHQQIKKGNPLSTMFYLKCKAKKRGYIEQQDVKITGNMKFKADFGESNTIHTTQESEDNT
jgi:sRNA-binding carbon storage regulator CsrA